MTNDEYAAGPKGRFACEKMKMAVASVQRPLDLRLHRSNDLGRSEELLFARLHIL